jgi:hypothetical protein
MIMDDEEDVMWKEDAVMCSKEAWREFPFLEKIILPQRTL